MPVKDYLAKHKGSIAAASGGGTIKYFKSEGPNAFKEFNKEKAKGPFYSSAKYNSLFIAKNKHQTINFFTRIIIEDLEPGHGATEQNINDLIFTHALQRLTDALLNYLYVVTRTGIKKSANEIAASLRQKTRLMKQEKTNEKYWSVWLAFPLAELLVLGNPKNEYQGPMASSSKANKIPDNKWHTGERLRKEVETSNRKKGLATPVGNDMATKNVDGTNKVIIDFDNIDLYVEVFKNVFSLLDEKIHFYDIEFDKPFSAGYYVKEMDKFKSVLSQIIQEGDNKIIELKGKVTLTFSEKYDKLLSLEYSEKVAEFKEPAHEFFKNQTTNGLVFFLPTIYQKYITQYTLQGGVSSVFLSQEEIKIIINRYVVPNPTIVTSVVTKRLLEKFIIGDVRLLEDDYKKYRLTPQQIDEQTKIQLSQQIGQQYEQIGDFLGLKFEKGEFKEINNLDDLYKQLLDHIDMEDLIQLSAKCLLKMVPLDNLLDWMCEDVLEAFDDHQEKIIQELQSMEAGPAKALASELTEVYLDFINDTGPKYTEQIITQGVAKTAELMVESVQASTWSSSVQFLKFYEKNKNEKSELEKLLYGQFTASTFAKESAALDEAAKKAAKEAEGNPSNTTDQETKQENANLKKALKAKEAADNSIMGKLKRNTLRKAANKESIAKQKDRMKIFGTNPPSAEKTTLGFYTDEEAKLKTRDTSLQKIVDLAEDKIKLLELLSEATYHLVNLSPYIGDSELKKIRASKAIPAETKKGASLKYFTTKETRPTLAKLALKNGDLLPSNTKTGLFTFKDGYQGMTGKAKKTLFDQNIRKLKKLHQLVGSFEPDPGLWEAVSNFGEKTMKAYFDTVMGDETKRYYLCLAIYGAVPAVAYMIYNIIDDPAGAYRYVKNQGAAIAKGFKRRMEILGRTDYPIWDILGSLKDVMIQVGYNLGRDLILHGIMWVIEKMRKACTDDEEKINAPYDPVGAIDLSGFMANSIQGDHKTGEIDNSASFKKFELLGLTLDDYRLILDTLSSTFTIKEMARLLNNTAESHLYDKALEALLEVESLLGTPFADFYLSKVGIIEFFKAISKDINPAYIAQAIENFEKEKSILMSLCYGTDDSLLGDELSKFLSPEQVRQALADRATAPKGMLKDLMKSLDHLLGPPVELNTNCFDEDNEYGVETYDESQQHSANVIGDATFGILEEAFERDISRVKEIYLDIETKLGAFRSPAMIQMMNPSNLSKDQKDSMAADYKSDITSNVAIKLLKQVKNISTSIGFVRAPEGNNEDEVGLPPGSITFNTVIGETETSLIEHHTTGSYNPDTGLMEVELTYATPGKTGMRELNFEYEAPSTGQPAAFNTRLSLEDIFQEKINIDKKEQLWGISESGEELYVKPTEIAAIKETLVQTISSKYEKEHPETTLNELILLTDAEKETKEKLVKLSKKSDFYLTLMNSMFKDLFFTSFKNGLFNQKIFKKLTLNHKITYEKCFLGFVNKTMLNKEMQSLAKQLSCVSDESPTHSPVNIATIKIALDCLIRIIAIKELMKSLFVYNTFVSELFYDEDETFYDDFVSAEISKAFAENDDINLNNEVIIDFITDIMRIIYSDDSITDEQAMESIKAAQLNYVKYMVFNALPDEVSYPAIDGANTSPFQIVKSAKEGLGQSIALKGVNIVDKIKLLQNEEFAMHVDRHYSPEGAITKTRFNEDGVPGSVIFERSRNEKLKTKYFDFETLELSETSILKKLLQENNSGVILEDTVEFKHNPAFVSSMTDDQRKLFANFLVALFSQKLFDATSGHHIRGFLYESKLIMMFPQLKKIIDISAQESSSELEKAYKDTDILVKMFDYNYSPDSDQSIAEDWSKQKTSEEAVKGFFKKFVGSKNAASKILNNDDIALNDLDMSLSGKIYRNDLAILMDSFLYPYQDASSDSGTQAYPEGYNSISALEMYEKHINGISQTSALLNAATNANITGIKDAINKPIWPKGTAATGATLLEFLYFRPVSDIINVSTVISLNGYIDINEQEDFNTFKNSEWAEANTKTGSTFVADKLKNKIGQVYFDDAPAGIRYFTFPIEEAKVEIPSDLTWFDFFVKTNPGNPGKASFYQKFLGDGSSTLYKNGAYKLNDVLFAPKESDIFSYTAALNAITTFDLIGKEPIAVFKYESTDWFNIRGWTVSKEQILQHVAGPATQKIPGLHYASAPATDHWTDSDQWEPDFYKLFGDGFAYLTRGSLKSLKEEVNYFFDEKGDRRKNVNGIRTEPDPMDEEWLKTPGMGYSITEDPEDIFGQPKVVVGEYIATNPVTGQEEVMEKYIQINHRYHIQLPNANIERIKERFETIYIGKYGFIQETNPERKVVEMEFTVPVGVDHWPGYPAASIYLQNQHGLTAESAEVCETDGYEWQLVGIRKYSCWVYIPGSDFQAHEGWSSARKGFYKYNVPGGSMRFNDTSVTGKENGMTEVYKRNSRQSTWGAAPATEQANVGFTRNVRHRAFTLATEAKYEQEKEADGTGWLDYSTGEWHEKFSDPYNNNALPWATEDNQDNEGMGDSPWTTFTHFMILTDRLQLWTVDMYNSSEASDGVLGHNQAISETGTYPWGTLYKIGFRSEADYQTCFKEVKKAFWRKAFQDHMKYDDAGRALVRNNMTVKHSDDPQHHVVRRTEISQGYYDIDWGWHNWRIRQELHWSHEVGKKHAMTGPDDGYINAAAGGGTADDKRSALATNENRLIGFANYNPMKIESSNMPNQWTKDDVAWGNNKWPGTTFMVGMVHEEGGDRDPFHRRPHGNHHAPGIIRPGNFTGTKPIEDQKWNKGAIHSGVASATKSFIPLKLDGVVSFNIYNVFEKMLLSYGEMGGYRSIGINNLIKSFFALEQTTIISVLHRLYGEIYYPSIEGCFKSSISKASEVLLAAVASANGEYRRISPLVGPENDSIDWPSSEDLQSFGLIITKAFVTAIANTVDPTWTTPWFAPGPFTPFGALAKGLNGVDAPEEPPDPAKIAYKRPFLGNCEEQFEDEYALLKKMTKNEKPEEE